MSIKVTSYPINTATSSPKLSLPFTLTFRGFLFLILSIYLLFLPARLDHDIIATIFATSLLGVLVLLAGLTLLVARKLQYSLTFSMHIEPKRLGIAGVALVTGEMNQLVLRLSAFQLPPLLVLRVKVIFEEESLPLTEHRISGKSNEHRVILDEFKFPHRGKWTLKHIKFCLEDQFGFASYNWLDFSGNTALNVVHPPFKHNTSFPVISSLVRVGDDLPDPEHRQGDPFDLKPYHPSDGMRKVLWKIYAKSGELISRHPEKSMTPEGKTVVFVLASLMEDGLSAEALAYLRQLEELQLEIVSGCEGMSERKVALSASAAEDLLINTAWDTRNSGVDILTKDLGSFLEQVGGKTTNARIENVLVFADAHRLHSEEQLSCFVALGETLEKHQIKPIFMLTGGKEVERGLARGGKIHQTNPLIQKIAQRMFLGDMEEGAKEPSVSEYLNFLNFCRNRDWRVIL